MKARLLFLIASFASALAASSCVTPAPAEFGVQANHLAHIPARIAVLPCRDWPQGALYVGQEKITAPEAEMNELCANFDKYVLAGFEGQPYMRGIAPAVVKRLLERNPKQAQLDQLEQLWFRPSQVCEACRNSTSYYKDVVASREDWRLWLSGVSRETSSADALLIPFIAQSKGEVINDRGIYYASRKAEIVLLLVDTNNGELIWAGGKHGEIRLPIEKKPADEKAVALPTWEELNKRIFVPELWAEFPGRQG
ncbi:MAG: hypothetical protein EOP07_11875 [Proteobacteria bacterium]|nr:MAG: hypothetical protein EOP07_11875 [Pseudomonadota bacterium]